MIVNLIKEGELVEEEAVCTAKETVDPKDGKQLPVEFECKIENIENANQYTGLEIVESDEISGIPIDNKELINPVEVDILIKEGKVLDYTSEEFKNEEIPIFNPTSIDTTDSETKGIFVIIGQIISEITIERSYEFGITLVTGQKAECKLPKINGKNKEVKIKCELKEKIEGYKIMIEQCTGFSGYNQIIIFNKISSVEEITFVNVKEINKEKIEEKYDINLSFGQVSGFKVEVNIIVYIFIGYSTQILKKDERITMIVNLIRGKKLVEEEAVCISKEEVDPKDGKQLPVEFECKVENVENPEQYTGLEVVESDEISGIPTDDKDRTNPAKTDKLIEKEKVPDFSSDEFKEKEIPIFNPISIDTTESATKGIFIIIGQILSEIKIERSFNFYITLVTGQKAECK